MLMLMRMVRVRMVSDGAAVRCHCAAVAAVWDGLGMRRLLLALHGASDACNKAQTSAGE